LSDLLLHASLKIKAAVIPLCSQAAVLRSPNTYRGDNSGGPGSVSLSAINKFLAAQGTRRGSVSEEVLAIGVGEC